MAIENMYVSNAPDAYREVLHRLKLNNVLQESDRGMVYAFPGPLVVTIANPCDRVVFDPTRDCNPFFHLMEAIWMLAGSNDATWLTTFNRRMAEFAEPDGHIHGAYGHRWRNHFGRDQLYYVVSELKRNRNSRRAVLAMWDPRVDCIRGLQDIPCNTNAYFRISDVGALDMTVCSRSNDILWGMLGSNVVHMTLLQELIAGTLAVPVGSYTVFANNAHVYKNNPKFDKIWYGQPEARDPYRGDAAVEGRCLNYYGGNIIDFLVECEKFCMGEPCYIPFFNHVAEPMAEAWAEHRAYRDEEGAKVLDKMPARSDWALAGKEWLARKPARGVVEHYHGG